MGAENFLYAQREIESKRAGIQIQLPADVGEALPLPVRLKAESVELLLDERIDLGQELDNGRKSVHSGDSALSGMRNPVALLPREFSLMSFSRVFGGVGSGCARYVYLVFHAVVSGLTVVKHP